jgi:hypothetical protein
MNKLIKDILSFVIIFHSFNSFAQKDFKPGYLINNSFDTVCGLINLKSNYQNSQKCIFKQTADASTQEFKPFQIQSYRFTDGKYYISKTITINSVKKDVFLEYLVNGYSKLFYYKDLMDHYYFIQTDSSELFLMENKEVQIKSESGDLKVFHNKKYIGALKYIYRNDKNLYPEIDKSDFDSESLIDLSKKYHEDMCPEKECIVYVKNNTSDIWIAPKVGFCQEVLKFKTSDDIAIQNKIFFGLQLRITPKIVDSRWNFITGLNYTTVSLQGEFSNTLFTYKSSIFIISINSKAISLPIQAEYNFFNAKFSAGCYFGIHNYFYIKPEYSIAQPNSGNRESLFRNYNLGLDAGIDLRYSISKRSNIFLQAGYEYRRPIVNANNALDYISFYGFPLALGYEYKL